MLILESRELGYRVGPQTVLAGLDFGLDEGEIVAVTGPSGSGKTTLLHCLAGIQRPTAGEVWFRGERLDGLSDDARAAVRLRFFGFVLQHGDLLPQLTLAENVSLPLLLAGRPRQAARVAARSALGRFGVPSAAAHRFPGEVSGGEAQRAAVARALVHGPAVVFADEPTGSLDSDNGDAVMAAFVGAAREDGAGVVLVTHDPATAAHADRRLVLSGGRLREPVG